MWLQVMQNPLILLGFLRIFIIIINEHWCPYVVFYFHQTFTDFVFDKYKNIGMSTGQMQVMKGFLIQLIQFQLNKNTVFVILFIILRAVLLALKKGIIQFNKITNLIKLIKENIKQWFTPITFSYFIRYLLFWLWMISHQYKSPSKYNEIKIIERYYLNKSIFLWVCTHWIGGKSREREEIPKQLKKWKSLSISINTIKAHIKRIGKTK